jgi:hypothetical protein
MAGLVSLADQLDAAVSEVVGSWQRFKYGSESGGTPDRSREEDRIVDVGTTLAIQIERIRSLAEEINSRS